MNAQSAKTPIQSESVTITLTTREFAFIQGMIYARSFLNHQESDEFKVCEVNNINFVDRLKKKLDYFQPNIGDACATPAHIPEAPGQGGTNLHSPDCICVDCCNQTSLWSDAVGQGGSNV